MSYTHILIASANVVLVHFCNQYHNTNHHCNVQMESHSALGTLVHETIEIVGLYILGELCLKFCLWSFLAGLKQEGHLQDMMGRN